MAPVMTEHQPDVEHGIRKAKLRHIVQLATGFAIGIGFGFALQKSGVVMYNLIIAQLMLIDFTVIKVMLTAVAVGMIGIYALKQMGKAQLHLKPGSFSTSVVGALIFGVGFGVLGYCPGTLLGAVGTGALDALIGGIPGILLGSWLFALVYPKVKKYLDIGDFGTTTIPELFKSNPWVVIGVMQVLIIGFFVYLETVGL